eukprot:11997942-Alexandrium_andersonii.AAC.1
MSASLVGSEMCIRDRDPCGPGRVVPSGARPSRACSLGALAGPPQAGGGTVSYTHLTLPTICSV